MTEPSADATDPFVDTAARFQAVVETIVDGIITIDERGLIDFANPAAERMFGYAPGELIGRNVSQLMPQPDASQHDGYLKNYVQTGVAKVIGIGREVLGQRADGTTFLLDLAVSEVRTAGRRLFTGVVRDITERRQAEQKLKEAQQETEAANRAKTAFLRNMSHELRTPLTPILGYADLLLEDELSEGQREMIESIRRNSEQLLKQVTRLLEMAAIDEGCRSVETEPCEPAVLARHLQMEFASEAEARGLALELEISPEVPQICWTDPPRVREILKLLFECALDGTSHGGICLVVRTTERRSEVIFDVIATGCLLTQENLTALFDASTPYDSHTLQTTGLGGFGLPLAQRLAERIGGRLSADSDGSAGSRFTLHLPLMSPQSDDLIDQPMRPAPKPAEPAFPVTTLQGKRILLAEDTRENQRLIQHMMAKLGLKPAIVANGYAAVTEAFLAETAGRPFDLILMDIQMPGLNGWEATRRLRTAGLEMPVIALTALASPDDQQECLDAGCQEVVTKPVSFAKFTDVLQRWLTSAKEPAVNSPASRELVAGINMVPVSPTPGFG